MRVRVFEEIGVSCGSMQAWPNVGRSGLGNGLLTGSIVVRNAVREGSNWIKHCTNVPHYLVDPSAYKWFILSPLNSSFKSHYAALFIASRSSGDFNISEICSKFQLHVFNCQVHVLWLAFQWNCKLPNDVYRYRILFMGRMRRKSRWSYWVGFAYYVVRSDLHVFGFNYPKIVLQSDTSK